MEWTDSMPLGVVVERRKSDHPWGEDIWRPVAVIPGAGPIETWQELAVDSRVARLHIATLPLNLYRRETEAYRYNVSNEPPVVYVILRRGEDAGVEAPVVAHLVTASPYEAQDYLDGGDEIVEGVTMPPGVIAWVQAFIDTHHVDEPFRKRKRKRHDPEQAAFSRRPASSLNGRQRRG